MRLLGDLAIRSSFILLTGLALNALLAGRSAALRHWVLAAAIFAAAAVLPLTLTVPAWEVSLPSRLSPPASIQTAAPQAAPPLRAPITSTNLGGSQHATTPPASVLPLIAIIWAAGCAAGATMLLVGIARLMRIGSRAVRVQDRRWTGMARRVAATYGLRRDVTILQTDAADLLATWGLFRPRVLLPSHARDWSDDRVHVVLCHELAHIRRHDWFVQMAAEAVRTVFWFNPLIWIACTRLRRESEQACDDAVLERDVPAREYASHLLELARKCRRPEVSWASGMPMARPSTLERRIAAMLNPGLNRTALSRRAIVLTAALLLAVTLPIAAFRAAQSAPATLVGSVYDTTGAVLPAVELTLEDANQNTSKAVTDATGRFYFQKVAPGRYVLAASLPGFRPLRHEFELQNTRDWDRAITLQVGDLRETIHVRESRVTAPRGSAQPQAAKPIRVGGNIRVPRKEVDVRPIYPVSMREAGREGLVPMEAVIGVEGTVTYVRVLSAQVHPDFAMAAVDAVRQWRFSPTLLNGKPVEVVMTVSIEFNLSDQQ
jgi:TonB family protein